MEWANRSHNLSFNKRDKPDVNRLEAGNRLSVSERMKETKLKNQVGETQKGGESL